MTWREKDIDSIRHFLEHNVEWEIDSTNHSDDYFNFDQIDPDMET